MAFAIKRAIFSLFHIFSDIKTYFWRQLRRCLPGFLLGPALVWAQSAAPDQALQLKKSSQLEESIDPVVRSQAPTFVFGDSISNQTDARTRIAGHAMLRKADVLIKADELTYSAQTGMAQALGNVYINQAGNVYQGPLLEMQVDTLQGFFQQPSYQLLKSGANGQASRIDFVNDQQAVIHDATFTTCQREDIPDWVPDWILKASQINIDHAENVGSAKNAVLIFKGLPLLAIPYISFPLGNQRKSGLLAPTFGLDNIAGLKVKQPYYWNIAPNLDATITPTLLARRGLNLGTEFRYLEPNYEGSIQFDWLAQDRLRYRNRWSLSSSHQARLDSSWTDDGILLGLNLNHVSDNDYWKDFSRVNSSNESMFSGVSPGYLENKKLLTERLLTKNLELSWRNGQFHNRLSALKWQTLQDLADPGATIVPPYDRLPQLSSRYASQPGLGLDLMLDVDYTRFQSDPAMTGQPNGQRLFSLLQLSRAWRSSSGFVRPKLQLHVTQYAFDTALADGRRQAARVVPTFSLDTGLVFERDVKLFGRNASQTLEPRAFYVYTPYRDQSFLPNYDSGASDFNLSTIYTENAFVGNDRISDSHQLTLGATSRLLNKNTGTELMRFGLAQQILFADQRVRLSGDAPLTNHLSDLLWMGSVNWSPHWNFGATVQYNGGISRTARSTLNVSYRPGSYRVINASYRFQRDNSEQYDISWQWPLTGSANVKQRPGHGRWYSVGRLNYSAVDKNLVNSVLGFEYQACCWQARVVVERQQTGIASATRNIMFQLVFAGFAELGISPLQALRNSIPGYQTLATMPPAAPSRFNNYD